MGLFYLWQNVGMGGSKFISVFTMSTYLWQQHWIYLSKCYLPILVPVWYKNTLR